MSGLSSGEPDTCSVTVRLGFAPTGSRQLVRPEEPGHFEEELALRFG